MQISGAVVRRAAALLDFPPGTGELIDQPTRRRLLISLGGSIVLSLLDVLGVLAMVPLLQLAVNTSRDVGALGRLNTLLGDPGDLGLAVAVSGTVIFCFAIKGVFALVLRRWQLRFMAHQEVELSVRMLSHYLKGPYTWQLAQNTGDKVWTINSAVSIGYSGGMTSALAMATEVLTIVLILVSLAFVSPLVTLGAVVYFGLAATVMLKIVRPRVLDASRLSQEAGRATSHASLQSLTSGKEIKLRNAADAFTHEYHKARVAGADAGARAGFLSEVPKYVIEIFFVFGIGLLAVALMSQGERTDSLILLGVFAAAGTRIMPSVVRLLAALNTVRFARSPLEHLVRERRLLDMAISAETSRVVTTQEPHGDIDICAVSFAYPARPERPVLTDVSFTIEHGTSVALVGASGAGKSTMVDLLLGLLTPTAGHISAGGTDINSNLPAWQRRVAVVPQDVVLFDATLSANITFELDYDEQLVSRVLERAQLIDVVAQLPMGLESDVGERGARLSGGQRQRIGIARALYRQPDALFLDEATSALDNETESRLAATIDGLKGDTTVVVVAHRLSTVRNCDRVIFMADGHIEAAGRFEQLVEVSADFAHLVRLGSLA